MMLCNIDGKFGREVIPFSHDTHYNLDAKKWERMSVAQRIDEIRSELTNEEVSLFQARLSSICGTRMDKRDSLMFCDGGPWAETQWAVYMRLARSLRSQQGSRALQGASSMKLSRRKT